MKPDTDTLEATIFKHALNHSWDQMDEDLRKMTKHELQSLLEVLDELSYESKYIINREEYTVL